MEPAMGNLKTVQNQIAMSKQRLFSYGTLQQRNVQVSTFGRELHGQADRVIGYILAVIEIQDPEVRRVSGKNWHPILKFTGSFRHQVPGTVFELDDSELIRADAYEVDSYQRVEAPMANGGRAWVYVSK
jgi:gamma-glutamylcyclotransferase (GGCT)/AIG2-like uncharacterized protein YtfP